MHAESALSSPHPKARSPRAAGYSLIEVAVVLVVIGVIAAVAIPRLSRGSQGSADAATTQNAAVLQKALDLYAAEHAGAYPQADQVTDQLTLYTDAQGAVSKRKVSPFEFGPYVRKVPAIPTGPNKGSSAISSVAGPGIAWVYNPSTGAVTPNLVDDGNSSPVTLPATSGDDGDSD